MTALVNDEQNYLDEMTKLICDFGTQRYCLKVFLPIQKYIEIISNIVMKNFVKLPMCVHNRLKIEQAARDYNFRKITKRQANSARHFSPDYIRKEDYTWI